MEDLHAPLKDQIDDETILFDLDTSMDAGRDMNITSNYDNDSDTQKSQVWLCDLHFVSRLINLILVRNVE